MASPCGWRQEEKVAFVGASGAGKSTLMQVLLGLYPADSGEIRFGGRSVREIGFETVRENVAIVLQHPTLFNDTLRSNLTLGQSLSDDALWEALRVSQLREWAQALPQKAGDSTRSGWGSAFWRSEATPLDCPDRADGPGNPDLG